MKTIKILFIVLLFIHSSCQRMDPFLFNNDNTITEYKKDAYTGEQDFILDDSYKIPDHHINDLVLESKGSDDKEAVEIRAVYLGDINRISTDTVIVYCHGNKWHMDFYWQRAKLLANIGGRNRFGVLMMDYRGFGLSGGKPTEEGMYSDVRACLSWLKSKGLSSDRLVIYGFSLGSAPSTYLSANPSDLTPSKLILEAPFASSEVMVQDASKLNLSAKFFVDLKIENAEQIKKVNQPFMWLHGYDDDFLALETHGQVVFDNYKGVHGEGYRIVGAGHGTVPQTIGFGNYTHQLLKFITWK